MADEKHKLSIDEQESIAKAVLMIVAAYTEFPSTITQKNIHLDSLANVEDIGIYPTTGAVVLKTYVSGSFEAQFPFTIFYKCQPTTNQSVVDKREVLEGLGKWMENIEYPDLSDGRKIQSIKRTTTVTMAGKDESGYSIFQFGCTLKYFKKRS